MKKFLIAIPAAAMLLASCGGGSHNDALEAQIDTLDEILAAGGSFNEGNAATAEQYFFGVQAEVVEIDIKMAEIDKLDQMDADVEEFNAVIDSALHIMTECRKAMALYEDKNWAKKDKLNELTHEWFDGMVDIINNYVKDLAEPMSRPDEDLTDDEFDLFAEYYAALEEFYADIDMRWVEFQYEYGDEHGIVFGDESYDVEELAEEEMAANAH